MPSKKGIERNFLIKKFIKDILYSKEQIHINLYYSDDFDAFKNSSIPTGDGLGRDKKEKETFISLSENPQFVLIRMATLSLTNPSVHLPAFYTLDTL